VRRISHSFVVDYVSFVSVVCILCAVTVVGALIRFLFYCEYYLLYYCCLLRERINDDDVQYVDIPMFISFLQTVMLRRLHQPVKDRLLNECC